MIIIKIILGLALPIIITAILFLINPILGVLSIIWFTIVAIYALRKDLIMKFLGWIFGAKK